MVVRTRAGDGYIKLAHNDQAEKMIFFYQGMRFTSTTAHYTQV